MYVEINFKLGLYPLLKTEKYKNEIIIHGPYSQIIYTPAHKHRE